MGIEESPEDILDCIRKAEAQLWEAGIMLRKARHEIETLRCRLIEQGIELSNYRILAKRYATRR